MGDTPLAPDGREYTLDNIRRYCAEIGLAFDEEGAEQAKRFADCYGIIQSGFDEGLRMYADRIKHLFTPTNYTFRQRLALACHFLFNPRRWR